MVPDWKPAEADGDEDEPVLFASEKGATVLPNWSSLCFTGAWAARLLHAFRAPCTLCISGYLRSVKCPSVLP